MNMRAMEFIRSKHHRNTTEYVEADHVTDKLRTSKYGNEEDLATMIESFERSTKPTFKDPSDRCFIKFGSMRDRDADVGIRSGQLALEGYVCIGSWWCTGTY